LGLLLYLEVWAVVLEGMSGVWFGELALGLRVVGLLLLWDGGGCCAGIWF
jgi:hypothetical protein